MGSGKVIKQSIEKNGIENFTKTILEHFDSAEEMYAREKEVVNEEFLGRDDTYNLRRGGFGGFDYLNKTGLAFRMEKGSELASRLNRERALTRAKKMREDPDFRARMVEAGASGGKKAYLNHGCVFSKLNGTEKFEEARNAAIRRNPQVGSKTLNLGPAGSQMDWLI
jgi:hypothetical protein